MTVLIADDDSGTRGLIRRMIEGVVQVVGEATNDEEAMRLAQALSPDLILVDVDLPLRGGVSLTHRIKAQLPETKVIVMTAHEEEAYLSDTGRSGADALLPKKRVRAEALSVVRATLENRFRPWDGRERRRFPGARSRWNGRERRKRLEREGNRSDS